jgi:predicted transcriptional regulator of viral defense system
MTRLPASTVWRRLDLSGKNFTTSSEIRKMASSIGKDDTRSLLYLQEQGYIQRILRGIFYVKTPDELERGSLGVSIYEMVSRALRMKGVRSWYFGLESALKLNEMTHEFFPVEVVVTDSFRTTKIIGISYSRFQFLRWSPDHFRFGLVRRRGLIFSDKEKTVLDIAYKRLLERQDPNYVRSIIREYEPLLDKKRLKEYLSFYPSRLQDVLR